jgi:hypothetical protein
MLDGKADKAQLCGDTDSDLVPRLRDPNLLNAFAALADDLRMVLKASGRGERAMLSARFARDCSRLIADALLTC